MKIDKINRNMENTLKRYLNEYKEKIEKLEQKKQCNQCAVEVYAIINGELMSLQMIVNDLESILENIKIEENFDKYGCGEPSTVNLCNKCFENQSYEIQ